jgi:hypothetical protein
MGDPRKSGFRIARVIHANAVASPPISTVDINATLTANWKAVQQTNWPTTGTERGY